MPPSPARLDADFRADFLAAADDGVRLRVVVDQVASLTDVRALSAARAVGRGAAPLVDDLDSAQREEAMAGRINTDDIATVKARSSIEDVVREHVTLRPAGPGALKGLCPFHDEKTPSFNISPAVGAWHCFGCGEGGDVISFVQKVDHLTFAEAVERLAQRSAWSCATRTVAPGRARGSASAPG